MKVDRAFLTATAASLGARPDMVEKVIQLLGLLNNLNQHPFLKGRWVLKGGTALNLFVLNFPRLSVDIDLNYVGAEDRDTMLAERPKVEQAIQAVSAREGFVLTRVPTEHAGGKWRLAYSSSVGEGGNLELDLNFMFRVPLWAPTMRDSAVVAGIKATQIPVLDIHELASGKLAALMARHVSRDLYDAHGLLTGQQLDDDRLRLGFVVYGGMNRIDWRTVRVENIEFSMQELRDQLIPVVRRADSVRDIEEWARPLLAECRAAMGRVLPLRDHEVKFLTKLNDHAEIDPFLLTSDKEMASRISRQPWLLWKAQNVRKHKKV
jgi:hypothetical protein